jgi:membrane-bound metal-dependent hydrolase YbcI (DUF457 family)
MEYYDHAMLGAVLALSSGAQRRFGWPVAVVGAAAAALPDWDDLPGGVHRVWGHNLFVAPVASGLVGGLGYLCYQSIRDRLPGQRFSPHALAVWVAIGVLASLSHVLADVVYCGTYLTPDWPVALLWPLSRRGWALPLVPWADRGVTVILVATLAVMCCRPRQSRVFAVLSLLAVLAYVGTWAVAAFLAG